jgi:putative SOS response-associated peptidase YedK
MCNLYHMTPKGEIARYFRARLRNADPLERLTVGPFQAGVFIRAAAAEELEAVDGQWGMIRPGAPARWETAGKRPRLTNNSRSETAASRPTFRQAWARGQRCLIPAMWYQEPNWETGRNVWWQLRRQDGEPWAIAGLWSEWTDRETGEVVPNYTMLTINCDDHPMLRRLHRPDPALPADAQDKRAVVHVPPEHWGSWLRGDEAAARALLRAAPQEDFDKADALRTDELLRGAPPAQASLLA